MNKKIYVGAAILAAMTVPIWAETGRAGNASVVKPVSDMPQEEDDEDMRVMLKKIVEISAEDVQILSETHPDLVIIDSRKAGEYAQGHIPKAIMLRADEATEERLTALAASKQTPMIFYCGSKQCPASGHTAYKAAKAGYTRLYKYSGGIADWKSKGLPVVAK